MGLYPATIEYLGSVAGNNGTTQIDHALQQLFKALEMDGYNCPHSFPAQIAFSHSTMYKVRSLRGIALFAPSSEHHTNVSAIFMVIVCIVCAGLASGLTQGLLSLDLMELKIKSRSGTPDERIYASKVLPIISRHHFLLVTLMLWNASATEALPVFLSCVVPEYLAIIISVTMILFVGEIIPTAIITGPKQLQIASHLVPLVYLVNIIFFPIAYPISLVLDYVLGNEEGMTVYTKREIATLMAIQHEEGARMANSSKSSLHYEEVSIIDGALKFRDMLVSDVMTPIQKVFMLSYDEELTSKTLALIFQSGFSRIPVYERNRNDVIGIIRAKDLIFVDPEGRSTVSSFVSLLGRQPLVVWHDDQLGETLSSFRREKSHIAIVRNVNSLGPGDPFYEVVGIITLEDIIEEILGTEIEDDAVYIASTTEYSKPNYKKSNHIARLQLLNKTFDPTHLATNQIEAIAFHLLGNVKSVKELFSPPSTDDFDTLCRLIVISPILNLGRFSKDASKPVLEDTIYRRGRVTNCCALIISGTIEVVSGASGIKIQKGPWTVIAPETLIMREGTYFPDFTVTVLSDTVHLLMISVHSQEACSIPALQSRKTTLGINSISVKKGKFFGESNKSPKFRQKNVSSPTYSVIQSMSPGMRSSDSPSDSSPMLIPYTPTKSVSTYGSIQEVQQENRNIYIAELNLNINSTKSEKGNSENSKKEKYGFEDSKFSTDMIDSCAENEISNNLMENTRNVTNVANTNSVINSSTSSKNDEGSVVENLKKGFSLVNRFNSNYDRDPPGDTESLLHSNSTEN